MNIAYRRLIAFFFILAFIILAPVLLYYTAGYRYDLKKGEVQKTGSLVLSSIPRNAEILLNDKLQDTKSPSRLNNILPGDYEITLQKEGYHSWNKKLSVKISETTFAENVVLFKKSGPEKILDEKVNMISFSPEGKYALLKVSQFSQDFLYLLNLSNQKVNLIYNDDTKLDNLQVTWAPDDSKMLLQSDDKLLILTTSWPRNTLDLLPLIAKNKARAFKFDADNSNYLFAMTDKEILRLDLILQKADSYVANLPKLTSDFLLSGQDAFFINKIADKTFLSQYSLLDKNIIKTLELKNTNYCIIDIIAGQLVVEESASHDFFLIDQSLDSIQFSKPGVVYYNFKPSENLLLIATAQELSQINLSDFKEKIINRVQGGLQKALWHIDDNYSFSLQAGKINIIEIDDRNGHFSIILPFDNISDFQVDPNGEILYFLQNNLLYSLAIQ